MENVSFSISFVLKMKARLGFWRRGGIYQMEDKCLRFSVLSAEFLSVCVCALNVTEFHQVDFGFQIMLTSTLCLLCRESDSGTMLLHRNRTDGYKSFSIYTSIISNANTTHV